MTVGQEVMSKEERSFLFRPGIGLLLVAGGLWWFTGKVIPLYIVGGIGVILLVSGFIGGTLGHNVFLILTLISHGIGIIVSYIALLLMYVFGIGVTGSVLRLFSINRLARNWGENRNKTTMFVDAPKTKNIFWRQS